MLSLDIKKIFMDEWTGEPQHELVDAVGAALAGAVPAILSALRNLP